MTDAERMQLALSSLGMSALELSQRAGVSERTARAWIEGRSRVPPALLAWAERLSLDVERLIESNPPPPKEPGP